MSKNFTSIDRVVSEIVVPALGEVAETCTDEQLTDIAHATHTLVQDTDNEGRAIGNPYFVQNDAVDFWDAVSAIID